MEGGSSFGAWVDLVSQGGSVALLLFIIWSGIKKLWVWGWLYFAVVEDRDEWKELALDLLRTAQVAVQVAEGTVEKE